jgi:uncharacterized RDD family membrane protein YckC
MEELTVRGLTGVDMTLTVAGVGTRAYAFIIDWHIRLLLALSWLLLGWLIARIGTSGGSVTTGSPTVFLLGVVTPSMLLYFLYHPVLELVMQGRTPGKRMAGARLVTREGATPAPGALLMRNLFRLIDTLPAFYALGLVTCVFTAQRVRFGDLAAGTVLVLDESSSKSKSLERMGALLQHSTLDPRAAALIEDVLERWGELEPQRRMQLARGLLEKLDTGTSPELRGALEEAQLRQRLQDLLGRT